MFNAKGSRQLFAITDLLSLLGLGFGVVFAAYGFFAGFPLGAISGVYLAAGGLSLLVVTHIGRALVHIAETSSAILERLSKE